MTKARRTIAAEDVDRVFNDKYIEKFAARLPTGADRRRFANAIREAARIYARDAPEPTVNELRAEIAALYNAADRRQCDRLAIQIEQLSPKARNLLNRRGTRLGLALPPPKAMNGTEADKACIIVAKLASIGGGYIDGRMSPTGKRSRTWRPLLHAPKSQRSPPKREAERQFIINLQLAWLEATGVPPSKAVNRDRPSPFAQMAAQCFKSVGAAHADVFGLINNVNRLRQEFKKRSTIKTRTG
jgi:hypothetical protein